MIHLFVTQGLCRRLVAIVCAMRWGRDIQHELTIYWKLPVGRTGLKYNSDKIYANEHLNLFFKLPPNIYLKTWEKDTLKVLQQSGAKIILDESALLPECMPRSLWGNPIYPDNYEEAIEKLLIVPDKHKLGKVKSDNFEIDINCEIDSVFQMEVDESTTISDDLVLNMVVNPFGYESNLMELEQCHHYRGNNKNKTNFEIELSNYARRLSPIMALQNIIDHEKKRLFNVSPRRMRVGFHFRRTDFRSLSSGKLEEIFRNLVHNKFVGWTIFIASDDLNFQNYLVSRYNNIYTYSEKSKVQNDLVGTQRSLVDLYLLSNCNYIVGTKGSAFTYYAWLLSDDNTPIEYLS